MLAKHSEPGSARHTAEFIWGLAYYSYELFYLLVNPLQQLHLHKGK